MSSQDSIFCKNTHLNGKSSNRMKKNPHSGKKKKYWQIKSKLAVTFPSPLENIFLYVICLYFILKDLLIFQRLRVVYCKI